MDASFHGIQRVGKQTEIGGQNMTPEEVHNYNRMWALSPISYEAVCTDDAVIAFREWLTKILEKAYDAGYNNAKKGEL